MSSIAIAETDEQIARCFAVVHELRPHLVEGEFVAKVHRQQREGFHLAALEHGGRVTTVAGFRILENFFSGKILYVDDLVTAPDGRSLGHGRAMFDWLVTRARAEACRTLELDSGVQRFDAHRFYLARRMEISSHHFRLPL